MNLARQKTYRDAKMRKIFNSYFVGVLLFFYCVLDNKENLDNHFNSHLIGFLQGTFL